MWKVTARDAREQREVSLPAIEIRPIAGEPLTARDVLRVARETSLPRPDLLRYLEAEAADGAIAHGTIAAWAGEAEGESRALDWAGAPFVRAIEEAIALFPPEGSAEASPLTLAWHDRSAVLVPLATAYEQLTFEYLPEGDEERAIERLRHRHATPEHRLETILDWRGYFGTNTAVIDGWSMMRRSGRGHVASAVGAAGFLVGTVLRRLTRPAPTLTQDPTARARRVAMEQKYPRLAAECPDLASIPAEAREVRDRAVVFVHGTVSCGLQGLRDLFPKVQLGAAPPPGIFRYEHDTFASLSDSASELATLVRERLEADQLLLVGHSRGGLVANLAASLLRRDGYRGQVSLHTLGSPHQGTPLVAQGGKVLNLLYRLGEEFAEAVPMPITTPFVKAFSYTVDSPVLPTGIAVMAESSGELALLRTLARPEGARAWGSRFAIAGVPSGFGVWVEGTLLGALADREHDLVVPVDSALAFGTREPLLDCSHVHYFREPVVRETIERFTAPAVQPAQEVTSLSTAASLATEPEDPARIAERNRRMLRERAAGAPKLTPEPPR